MSESGQPAGSTPTTVVPAAAPSPPPAGPPTADPRSRRFAIGCLAAAGVLVAAMIIGAVALGSLADRLNPFGGPLVVERTIERSGPPVLKTLTDLGEYRAATAYYELVIDVETEVDPLPSYLAGERILFVAAGNVDASVDFTQLDDAAVVVDAEQTTATITLPAPTLSEPRLDTDGSYVVSRDRGLLDRINEAFDDEADPADTQGLNQAAEQRLTDAAASNSDLTDRAEQNTRAFLTGLLTSAGYTDVTVIFEEGPEPSATGQ